MAKVKLTKTVSNAATNLTVVTVTTVDRLVNGSTEFIDASASILNTGVKGLTGVANTLDEYAKNIEKNSLGADVNALKLWLMTANQAGLINLVRYKDDNAALAKLIEEDKIFKFKFQMLEKLVNKYLSELEELEKNEEIDLIIKITKLEELSDNLEEAIDQLDI